MSADVGSIIAYVFYGWVAISGIALLIWVYRSRQLEKRELAAGPKPTLRPGRPNIDLSGLDHVTPPEPPKPPWLVNLQRFQDLEAQADSSAKVEAIEISDVDVEAAFDPNLSVAAEIDEELTAEIAPALVTEPAGAAQLEELEVSEQALEPTHIIADSTDAEGFEDEIIDLTDSSDSDSGHGDSSDSDSSHGDSSHGDSSTSVSSPTDSSPSGGPTIDLTSGHPGEPRVVVATDLFAALEGIQLPLDLLPIEAQTPAELEMRRFTFTTSTGTLRSANTTLGDELERLGYTIISTSAVEDVAHRLRITEDGSEVSETVVMTSHPSLPGDPVRISLEIEQPEMASPFLATG